MEVEDAQGVKWLDHALKQNDFELAQLLIDYGADQSKLELECQTIFINACRLNHMGTLNFLNRYDMF